MRASSQLCILFAATTYFQFSVFGLHFRDLGPIAVHKIIYVKSRNTTRKGRRSDPRKGSGGQGTKLSKRDRGKLGTGISHFSEG